MYPQDIDPREFGPDEDGDECPDCGAPALVDCEPDCECSHCIRKRENEQCDQHGDAA